MKKILDWLKNNYLKLIIIGLGVFSLIGLFLPYEKSIGDYRERLVEKPEKINIEEVDFKNSDVIDISIMENFKVYQYALENSDGNDWLYGESLINIILTITLIISTILVLIFAIFNKNILTIIFDVILAISSLVMNYDIVSRGVIPSEKYTYGISYYLYIIVAVIVIICSIILIVKKKKYKGNEIKTTKKNTKKLTKTKNEEKDNMFIKVVNNYKKIIKEKNISKKTISIILVIIVLFIVAIILISKINFNSSNNYENPSNNSTIIKTANTYDELEELISSDVNKTITSLENEWEELYTNINSYEKYIDSKEDVEEFYDKIYNDINFLCIRLRNYALNYSQLIVLSDKSIDDKYGDLDNIYDTIYEDAGDEIYDEIYDGILDEIYDAFYDGILDDSYDELEYSEWNKLSSAEYKLWNNTSSDVYKLWSNLTTDIYDFYSDLGNALYDEDLEEAKKEIQHFKENIIK